MQVSKVKLTQIEYDSIHSKFLELLKKQKSFRQSHIDAVNEGDDRECDAWSLTNDLSNYNYIEIKELNDILANAIIIKQENAKQRSKRIIRQGDRVEIFFNHKKTIYTLCNEHSLPYLENGLSVKSLLGSFLLGKGLGKYMFNTKEETISKEVEVLNIN